MTYGEEHLIVFTPLQCKRALHLFLSQRHSAILVAINLPCPSLGKDANMPTLAIRSMLFVSSYFPLALIFFVLFLREQPVWAIAALALGSLGLIILLLFFLRFAPRLGAFQEIVTGMQRRDGDVMS